MSAAHGGEDWLYHLPAFLDQLETAAAHDVLANLDADLGGVLYHHRGVRVPGYNATFVWRGDRFELDIDGVGSRRAWAVFETDREWDFFLSRAAGDVPYLAWMTDAEFAADEADTFETKQEAVGLGRFSFGLYLQSESSWSELEERSRDTDAPCFVQRPSGRSLVPDRPLEEYDSVVPSELLEDGEDPPRYLGLIEAHVAQ